MKCNLIVPGFAKCGTSSLYQYLLRHSDISMVQGKEPHYFSNESVYSKGEDWYDNLYSSQKKYQYYGDCSTTYSIWPKALERIKSETLNPKIILLLRDPVERLLSHYNWMFRQNNESRSLKNALKYETENEFSPDISIRGCYACYRRASQYSVFVPYIIDLFGKDSVYLIKSEYLSAEPKFCLDRLWEFLNVDKIPFHCDIRENQTRSRVRRNLYGLDRFYKRIPKNLKDKTMGIATRATGLFPVLNPQINESEIEMVKELLKEDVKFYNETFG